MPQRKESKVNRSSQAPDLAHDNSITETPVEQLEVIALEAEDQVTIAELVARSIDGCSVVVIPRALVGPTCGQRCLGCNECTAGKLQDAITHYYLDGAIHVVRQSQMGDVNIDKFVDALSL
jgi:hypothetical protein